MVFMVWMGIGPMFGDPTKTDLIIAANNVVVADTLGTQIMKMPLKKVEHIELARKKVLAQRNWRP